MFSFKKKSTAENSNDTDLKERLFFHDIVNQTHGLLLFLGQKELDKSTIDQSEVKMLASEIKTLQSLIRDHYDFKHKNLVQTYEWVPFSYAKLAFAQLSMTYLGTTKVSSSFKMEGVGVESAQVYYPCFYRIMNNLVKNIAEAKAESVEFEFSLKESGLFVKSKNYMKKTSENDLPEYLSQVILAENVKPISGLGLESIHHMAEENGGSFSFEISESTWVNRLFLPTQKLKSEKIAA